MFLAITRQSAFPVSRHAVVHCTVQQIIDRVAQVLAADESIEKLCTLLDIDLQVEGEPNPVKLVSVVGQEIDGYEETRLNNMLEMVLDR